MFAATRRCACVSTKPGMIVLPETSIGCAPFGIFTLPRLPIAVMRLSVTTMSAFSITSAPFIVITRAPRSTDTLFGMSRSAVMRMRVSVG